MSEEQTLPAAPVADANLSNQMMQLLGATQSPALQILLNDHLYKRCIDVAARMSQADGVTPKHLIGKPAACFAVVQMALIWKLSPQMVAGSTYETPGGRLGYEGKLCQAIMENSGKVDGQIEAEWIGPWEKIEGKFRIETKKANSGKDYEAAIQTWKREDEDGVGVIVTAQVKGESKPRTMTFYLKQAFPRNSTIWVTRTKQQLWYTTMRAFGNMAMPGIFMGVPFEGDEAYTGGTMVDVTPADAQPATTGRPAKPRQTKSAAAAQRAEEEQRHQHIAETVIEVEDPKPSPEKSDAEKEQERSTQGPQESAAEDDVGGAAEGGDQQDDSHGAEEGPGPATDHEDRQGDQAEDPGHAAPAQNTQAKTTAPATTEGSASKYDPLSATELADLRRKWEKGVLGAAELIQLDSLRSDLKDPMKRCRAHHIDVYEKLIAVYTGRLNHLKQKEGVE